MKSLCITSWGMLLGLISVASVIFGDSGEEWSMGGVVGKINPSDREEVEQNLPLSSVNLHINVEGRMANYTLIQKYYNPVENEVALHTEYSFPYGEGIIFIKMQIWNGEKTTYTEIMKKSEVQHLAQVSEDFWEVSLSLTQGKIVKMRGGILDPGKSLTVSTTFARLLPLQEGSWGILISGRYMPIYTKNIWDIVRRIVYVGTRNIPTYSWGINIEINAPRRITSINCDYPHSPYQYNPEGTRALFSITENRKIFRDDIYVYYKYEGISDPSLFIQKNKLENSFAGIITFLPNISQTHSNQIGEYIFILDCSGSMGGESIALAKDATELFIRFLSANAKFNIYEFGNSFKKYFPRQSSVLNTESNRNEAIRRVRSPYKSLGGTQLYPPLLDVFNTPVDTTYPRAVYVITNGQLADRDQVKKLISRNVYQTNIYFLGISKGVDRELVRDIANIGKGLYEYAELGEDLGPKVIYLLKNAGKPVLSDWRIEWPGGAKPDFFWKPEIISYNEPFMVYVMFSYIQSGNIVLKAQDSTNNQMRQWSIYLDMKQVGSLDTYFFQIVTSQYIQKNINIDKKEKEKIAVNNGVLTEQTTVIQTLVENSAKLAPLRNVDIEVATRIQEGRARDNIDAVYDPKKENILQFQKKMINTQESDGRWRYTINLLHNLNIKKELFEEGIPAIIRKLHLKITIIQEIWITINIIYKIRNAELGEDSEWRKSEERATAWLRGWNIPDIDSFIKYGPTYNISRIQNTEGSMIETNVKSIVNINPTEVEDAKPPIKVLINVTEMKSSEPVKSLYNKIYVTILTIFKVEELKIKPEEWRDMKNKAITWLQNQGVEDLDLLITFGPYYKNYFNIMKEQNVKGFWESKYIKNWLNIKNYNFKRDIPINILNLGFSKEELKNIWGTIIIIWKIEKWGKLGVEWEAQIKKGKSWLGGLGIKDLEGILRDGPHYSSAPSTSKWKNICDAITVEGYWEMNENIEPWLDDDLELEVIIQRIPLDFTNLNLTQTEVQRVWATILVISALRKEVEYIDHWVAIEDKALKWLRSKGVHNPEFSITKVEPSTAKANTLQCNYSMLYINIYI